jgi:hypothetical protein
MRFVIFFAALFLGFVGWMYYTAFLHDERLIVTEVTTGRLKNLRDSAKFTDLPGTDIRAERERNEKNLNELLDRLIANLANLANQPSKRWVIHQMAPTVDRMYLEDTEARERFIAYFKEINTIVGISSTNGAFAFKLIFF